MRPRLRPLALARTLGLDVNVELLADEELPVGRVQLVDHRQHARVDTLGVLAGQRFLGNDERLDTHERQRELILGLPLERSLGRRAGRKRGMSYSSTSTRTCRFADVADHDQRLARRGADEFARPDVHLQHFAVGSASKWSTARFRFRLAGPATRPARPRSWPPVCRIPRPLASSSRIRPWHGRIWPWPSDRTCWRVTNSLWVENFWSCRSLMRAN